MTSAFSYNLLENIDRFRFMTNYDASLTASENLLKTEKFFLHEQEAKVDAATGAFQITMPNGGSIYLPSGATVNAKADMEFWDSIMNSDWAKGWKKNPKMEAWLPTLAQWKTIAQSDSVVKFTLPNGEVYSAVFYNPVLQGIFNSKIPEAEKWQKFYDTPPSPDATVFNWYFETKTNKAYVEPKIGEDEDSSGFSYHTILAGIALAAGIAAMVVSGPVGWALFVGATAVGLVDAALYFKEEGSTSYWGWLMVALNVIPVVQLTRNFITIGKVGLPAFLNAMKAVKAGTQTAQQAKIVKEGLEELSTKQQTLIKLFSASATANFVSTIAKSGAKVGLKVLSLLGKIVKFSGLGLIFIGTTSVPYDMLYAAITGDKEEVMKSSLLRPIYEYYNLYQDDVDRQVEKAINSEEFKEHVTENPEFIEYSADPAKHKASLDSIYKANGITPPPQ